MQRSLAIVIGMSVYLVVAASAQEAPPGPDDRVQEQPKEAGVVPVMGDIALGSLELLQSGLGLAASQ